MCHGYARLLRFVGIDHEDLTTNSTEGQVYTASVTLSTVTQS
jgi:hypothetical protein